MRCLFLSQLSFYTCHSCPPGSRVTKGTLLRVGSHGETLLVVKRVSKQSICVCGGKFLLGLSVVCCVTQLQSENWSCFSPFGFQIVWQKPPQYNRPLDRKTRDRLLHSSQGITKPYPFCNNTRHRGFTRNTNNGSTLYVPWQR